MVVALLTDFGSKDGFVGAVKGVILSFNPSATLVDITHEVEPFNILEGSLILKAHYRYFPKGTIFLCVVDPGVGSERKALALTGGDYTFVGPDNGIFDLVVEDLENSVRVFSIENPKFMLPRINSTFHGRDVFAPAVGLLSRGLPPQELGPEINYTKRLNFPAIEKQGRFLVGEIIYFDRFGNAITNIPCGEYKRALFRDLDLRIVDHFLQGKEGELCCVCGSFGFLEIFVREASAKDMYGIVKGEKIRVELIS